MPINIHSKDQLIYKSCHKIWLKLNGCQIKYKNAQIIRQTMKVNTKYSTKGRRKIIINDRF